MVGKGSKELILLLVAVLSLLFPAPVEASFSDDDHIAYHPFTSVQQLEDFLGGDDTNHLFFVGKNPVSTCAVYAGLLKYRARMQGFDLEVIPMTDRKWWDKYYSYEVWGEFGYHLLNMAIVDLGRYSELYMVEPQTDQYWLIGYIR